MSNKAGFKAIPFREVVTFSAEHPTHRVKNLLQGGKWTSPKGHEDIFIDVELSLPSCYIKSLDIGNCWSASVDIEVGRADEASSKREPLLKCPANLMSRIQCQNGQGKEAMKFFNVDDFNPYSVGRWVDRIRIVCRQPYKRDVAFGLSTLVVRGNNLDDDDDESEEDAKTAAAKQRRSSYGVDMTHVDGVKKLKSKFSKQFTSSTPKSKYSSLFDSPSSNSQSKKNSQKTEYNAAAASNNHNSEHDEFRATVLEFINDVDPDNKLEYKELLRRWVQIRGRPKSETEKNILKELTKSHAFGISSKKTDLTTSAATASVTSSAAAAAGDGNDVVKKTFALKRKSNDDSFGKKKVKVQSESDSYDNEDGGGAGGGGLQSSPQKPKGKRGRPPKATAAAVKANNGSPSHSVSADVLSATTTQLEPPSVNWVLQQDPQKYANYDDSELRSAGILVHQKIYKKDKKLPLDGGSELFVEKGVLVTFYKNAKHIHMKVKEKVYVPEVEPEYVSGIFKDYTEQEIQISDELIIEEYKPKPISPAPATTKMPMPPVSPPPPPPAAKPTNDSTSPKSGGGGASGSRKRKSSSPTKRVPSSVTAVAAAASRDSSPSLSSADELPSPPASPAKKTPKNKAAAAAAQSANNSSSANNSPSKRKSYSSGGECPLCQRTFNRIKELMAHCSTCNGLDTSSAATASTPTSSSSKAGASSPLKKAAAASSAKASKANKASPTKSPSKSGGGGGGGTPGRKKKAGGGSGSGGKASSGGGSGSSSSVPTSDCPICSKKIPKNELERHARLCAEKAFG